MVRGIKGNGLLVCSLWKECFWTRWFRPNLLAPSADNFMWQVHDNKAPKVAVLRAPLFNTALSLHFATPGFRIKVLQNNLRANPPKTNKRTGSSIFYSKMLFYFHYSILLFVVYTEIGTSLPRVAVVNKSLYCLMCVRRFNTFSYYFLNKTTSWYNKVLFLVKASSKLNQKFPWVECFAIAHLTVLDFPLIVISEILGEFCTQ